MILTTIHSVSSGLPMALDTAGVTLVAGLVVFLIVAYDYYRHQLSGGEQ
ncbi:hypothetical protein [Halogranum amylolyticum]|nr:hypothetical protein [Halogranum amylolyticum]